MIRIGREAPCCLLARRGVTFQRNRTWKESTDPDYDAKLDRIEHVLEHFPDRTFAFDEFGATGHPPDRRGLLGPRKASRTGFRRPTTAPTVWALVLVLDVALIPVVDGRVEDRLLHRGFAAVDRSDGVADDYPAHGVVG